MLEMREIEAFLAVAEELHFGRDAVSAWLLGDPAVVPLTGRRPGWLRTPAG